MDTLLIKAYSYPNGEGEQIAEALDNYSLTVLSELRELFEETGPAGLDKESVAAVRSILTVGSQNYCKRLLEILRAPLLRIWLIETRHLLSAAPPVGAADLHDHFKLLPLMLLPGLFALRGDIQRKVFPAVIPANGRAGPLDLGWTVKSVQAGCREVLLSIEPDGVAVSDSEQALLNIPARELTSDSDGRHVKVHCPDGISIQAHLTDAHRTVSIRSFHELPEVIGGAPLDKWRGRLLDAATADTISRVFSLLKEVWASAYQDVRAFCRIVIPLSSSDSPRASVTNASVPLMVGVSIDADGLLDTAEFLIHETAHIKLDLLTRRALLLENDGQALYRHPWRHDPRPLIGVLYAAHAFVPVAELYGRALDSGCRSTRVRDTYLLRRSEVEQALEQLARHARWTEAGCALFKDLRTAFDAGASRPVF